MQLLVSIFGEGRDLSVLQMSFRAVVVFLLALLMLRITGQRTFGQKTAVDQVVMIILGAVLSRGVTGSSPFLPVICASFVIVLFHRFLAWIVLFNHSLNDLVKGKEIKLFENGNYLRDHMKKCMVTEKDIEESVRIEINEDDLTNVRSISMERCGSISIVKKEDK
jgi:uncharacterized membrane protein YcaP (DUF421 family)